MNNNKAVEYDFDIAHIEKKISYGVNINGIIRIDNIPKTNGKITLSELKELFSSVITNIIEPNYTKDPIYIDTNLDKTILDNSNLYIKAFMIVVINSNEKIKELINDEGNYFYKINSIKIITIN